MKNTNEFELVVSPARRSLWQLAIAALAFSLLLVDLYFIMQLCCLPDFGAHEGRMLADLVKSGGVLLITGIGMSVTKSVMIDVDQDKLISRFHVGPFYRSVQSKVPALDYVSVFLDGKERYQVNLWYDRNKHYQMYFFDVKSQAMKFGAQVATKLNLDLLDATEKGNFHDVDKQQFLD